MTHGSRLWWLTAICMLAVLPVIAQDAKERIAFQRNGTGNEPPNIVVMFTDNSKIEQLPQTKELPGGRVTPSLAPDGKTLAFAAKVGGSYKIFTWALDDQNAVFGEPKQVTKDDKTSDKFPVWSPDGKQLAYLASDKQNKASLRVINADGAEMKELMTDIGYQSTPPAWRPDGQALLYVDILDKKPVLKNVLAIGGLAINIRQQSPIIAACYSPDGTKIAAVIRGANGLNELWIIRPFGIGGTKIVDKISGISSVIWPNPQLIVFNGTKVAGKAGKGFWTVDPDGKGLSGNISGLADPKRVSFFSVQKTVLNGELPTAEGGDKPGPDPDTAAPQEEVPTGPVTIRRPANGATVHGVVPIKIITQKDVSYVVLKVGNLFNYAAAPDTPETGPRTVSYGWDTQAFTSLDPASIDPGQLSDPTRIAYNSLLRYPDGEYTITAYAMNRDTDGREVLVGVNSIKVTVSNSLPDSTLGGAQLLRYLYKDNEGVTEKYNLHGEGTLFGASATQAGALNANLDAHFTRALIEVKSIGSFTLRTNIAAKDEYPLGFGSNQGMLPELDSSALYSLSPNGDLTILTQRLEKIYSPLAQLAVPFPLTQVQTGTPWPGKMWVVTDLMDREATYVRTSNVLDGVEWMNDRKTVRIVSTYRLDTQVSNVLLATKPTAVTPSIRGSKMPTTPTPGAAGIAPPFGGPGMTPGMAPTGDANGVKPTGIYCRRYAWFDYEKHTLVRVEDILFYRIPAANLAVLGSATPAGGPGGPMAPGPFGAPPPPTTGGPFGAPTPPPTGVPTRPMADAWYVVTYSYNLAATDEENR
ncbi:MAG: TolB family protein [Armatimonadota bacterium]